MQKDTIGTHTGVRRPADGEGLDIKGSFLGPGRVVGDENKRTKTDLMVQRQTTAGNHVVGERKTQPHRKSLRRLPHSGCQLSWE